MKTSSSILLPLMGIVLTLGTQSCAAPEISLTPMLGAKRLDSPVEGKNKVWVEYQDLTAQGIEFEDAIREGLQDKIQDRGYETVRFQEEADWVLWATTRVVDRVESEEQFNETMASLGAVAGALGGGIAGHAIGGRKGGWIGAAAGGGVMGVLVSKLTQQNVYICVTDLQLGSRRSEEIQVKESSSMGDDISSATAIGIAQIGGVGTTEGATTTMGSSTSSESVRKTFFSEKEQRLLLTAKGTRMSLDQAKEMMIPKLIAGVTSQIPPYRGR